MKTLFRYTLILICVGFIGFLLYRQFGIVPVKESVGGDSLFVESAYGAEVDLDSEPIGSRIE